MPRNPRWVKFRERYPFSYNKKDKYYKFETNPRGYREGAFKQAGYNVNNNSIRVERINLKTENYTLKPY